VTTPALSAIVIAHDRRRFVRDAVESVVGQDWPRDRFEAVLVANFRDADLERFLDERGVRFVFSDAPRKGAKIDAALDSTRAPIVTLLDDDDLYEPSKLAAVAEEFRRDSSLVYYHHHQTIVDDRNRPLPPGTFRPRTRERLERLGSIYLSERAKRGNLGVLVRVDAEFNDSSVAIRRDVVERCREYLPRVNGATDTLLLYSALLVPGSLKLDSRPLTRYRVHQDNASLAGGDGDERYLERMYRFALDAYPDYEVIAEMVRASGNRSLRRHAEALLAVQRFFLRLRNPAIDRADMLGRVVALVPYLRKPLVRTNLRAELGGLLYLVAPRWVRRRYVREIAHPSAVATVSARSGT
jgi:glycosyltransferase involved in cell wall biosynthesis